MSGVKLYIDGKFVMESDITGFVLISDYRHELKLEAEGFKLRKGSSQPLEMKNTIYSIPMTDF